ncbi:MAG TPA: flagellar hook-length control protein FliK [Deltaproteobacteria bacterium]|nr:flagellar hook-length control protein FliK [Deltaproteobacteria bacterium]HOM29553.1 flagellar hook-length control protein FliK [Deltaproteobacteria bacterium]HPP81782.1 flagellar hook-length control protein FliK [Deltaproteobacteria bacterium]
MDAPVGALQKAYCPSAGQGPFEPWLEEASSAPGLSGTGPQAPGLGLTREDKGGVTQVTPQSAVIYLFALGSMGLSPNDIRAVVCGDPSGLSDDGLMHILETSGYDPALVRQVMDDAGLCAMLKESCVGALSSMLTEGGAGEGMGPHSPDAGWGSNQLGPVRPQVGAHGLLLVEAESEQASQGNTVDGAASSNFTGGAPARRVTEPLVQVLAYSVRKALEGCPGLQPEQPGVSSNVDGLGSGASPSGAQADGVGEDPSTPGPALEELVGGTRVLEETFGVENDTLRDLVFSAEPSARRSALTEAISRMTRGLDEGGRDGLQAGLKKALSVLKTVLSKDEYSELVASLKAAGHEVPAGVAGVPVNKGLFEAFAHRLAHVPEGALQPQLEGALDQVRQAIFTLPRAGEGSVSIRIHPPMLGRVDIDVFLEGGQVTATFKVDQPLTRDLIQQNMQVLKETLAECGIKAQQLVVTSEANTWADRQGPLVWIGSDGPGGKSNGQGRSNEGKGQWQERTHAPVTYDVASPGTYVEGTGLDLIA